MTDLYSAPVAIGFYIFDARDRPASQELQQQRPGHRRAKAESHGQRLLRGSRTLRAAERGRAEAVAFSEERVELPDARKTAGESDLDGGQYGIGQQTFGEQQPLGLSEFGRRHAEFAFNHAAQLPRTDAEFRRQFINAGFIKRARFDSLSGGRRDPIGRINQRGAGSEFRTASQAWAEPGVFGGGGVSEESAVIAMRRSRRTNRPAIDASSRYAHVQNAVKSRIARDQSLITTVVIE